MMLPNDIRNPELSEACKKLVAQSNAGIISKEEGEIETCYIAIKYCLGDLKLKPFPAAPELMRVYKGMSTYEQQKFTEKNPGFFKEGAVWEHFEEIERIKHENMRNKEFLKYMMETFNKLGDNKNEQIAYNVLLTHQPRSV